MKKGFAKKICSMSTYFRPDFFFVALDKPQGEKTGFLLKGGGGGGGRTQKKEESFEVEGGC